MSNNRLPLIDQLVEAFGRLPGIGRKSAQRLAFYLLAQPEAVSNQLAEAISSARSQIHLCPECCNLTDLPVCEICSDERRDHSIVCVVESPLDVVAMERTREYRGLYHVLHGAMSPINKIGPEDIHLKELMMRLSRHHDIQEVILANNATVEGEATAMFIARLLQSAGLKVTRIAQGLPMGSNIEYADEVTLTKALEGRQTLSS